MLNLASDSDKAWIEKALAEIDDVLIDHAHCEKKAASTALSLIFRYPHHDFLLKPLSELAREELRHFELMLEVLKKRGVAYAKQKPSPYAGQLMECVRTHEPDRLVDTLLCCSLIEARSCERMQLLAENLEDKELAALYKGLLASEARHHTTYVGMAQNLVSEEVVSARLKEIAQHEAEILKDAPAMARMHT